MTPGIDLDPLRRALSMLCEALQFWTAQPAASALKPHLRSAVIQSFKFSYELSVRMLRRVLMERSVAADLAADLAFNDLLRMGADAGLLDDPGRWREMRNATSHAYSENKAQEVAMDAKRFCSDGQALLRNLEAEVARL